MSVKIRLKRMGKIRAPYYRIVVADSRTKRDGRAIEEIGKYHPTEDPSFIEVNTARAQYWLGVGAQPTEQVLALLKVTGDWQKFKNLPGQEGTLRYAAAKVDKKAVFEAAAKEAMDQPKDGATTAKAKKKAEPKAESKAETKAEEAAPEAPAATEAPAETAAAPAEAAPVEAAPVEAADAADEGAPGASETSAQVEAAGDEAQAEG